MKKTSIYLALIVAVIFSSCGSSNDKPLTMADLVDTDLSSQGIPVIIKAPKDAEVTLRTKGGSEVSVDAGDQFNVDVTKYTSTDSLQASVASRKEDVSNTEFYADFEKFEVSEPFGYVTKGKSGKKAFFYAIPCKGGYIGIQNYVFGEFTPEDIDLMYQAAKLAKSTEK